MVENKNRLVLLDILRAVGVVLMIEGHTLDAVLGPTYKNGTTFMFQLWTFFRGLTAPFFFFSAGLAFVVATVKYNSGILNVPKRTKFRRIKRIVTLLLLGYGLHFPLELLYDPSSVPSENLKIFFFVDALHVISLSLLVILVIALFAKETKSLFRAYAIAGVLSLAIAPIIEPVPWENFLPRFFYSYLTFRSGSFFTFFPFSAYLFAGASFGAASIVMRIETRAKTLTKNFMRASIVSFALFLLFLPIQLKFVSPYVDYWRALPAVNLLRFSIVAFVAGCVGYLSLKIRRIPRILPAIGKSSLTIYVVHLMIVYGSPINLGLAQLIPGGTDPAIAMLLVAGVISLTVGMVYGIEVYRARKKRIGVITVTEIAK